MFSTACFTVIVIAFIAAPSIDYLNCFVSTDLLFYIVNLVHFLSPVEIETQCVFML